MDQSQLANLLRKIPWPIIAIFFALYTAYDVYMVFLSDPGSPLNQLKSRVPVIQADLDNKKKRISEMQSFVNEMEVKREQVRILAGRLEELETRGDLAEQQDLPSLIRQISTEAKKIGIQLESFAPAGKKDQQFYTEHEFKLRLRGIYVQLIVFLDRITSLQRLFRVDDFHLAPAGPQDRRFVELTAEVTLKSFTYLRSEADKEAEKYVQQSNTAPKTTVPPTANPGGGP